MNEDSIINNVTVDISDNAYWVELVPGVWLDSAQCQSVQVRTRGLRTFEVAVYIKGRRRAMVIWRGYSREDAVEVAMRCVSAISPEPYEIGGFDEEG